MSEAKTCRTCKHFQGDWCSKLSASAKADATTSPGLGLSTSIIFRCNEDFSCAAHEDNADG